MILTKKKITMILFVFFLQILVIEIFLTFVLYHWYKDRSEQPLLDHPLAIISTLKIINAKFEFFETVYDGKNIYRTNIPISLLPEFRKIRAGFENSNNPTQLKADSKPLTIPDPKLGWVLRKMCRLKIFFSILISTQI